MILLINGEPFGREMVNHVKYYVAINPLTADRSLRTLIDFTLSNARRFYSSMGNPLDGKGLKLFFKNTGFAMWFFFQGRIWMLQWCWKQSCSKRSINHKSLAVSDRIVEMIVRLPTKNQIYNLFSCSFTWLHETPFNLSYFLCLCDSPELSKKFLSISNENCSIIIYIIIMWHFNTTDLVVEKKNTVVQTLISLSTSSWI